MLVFDLNGTLVKRYFKKDITPSYFDHEYGNFYVTLRPNLQQLIKYLKTKNLKYIFWTNAYQINAHGMTNILIREGMCPLDFLHRDHCTFQSEICKKDLNVVSEIHNIDLQKIYLVEDTESRSIEGQNLISIQTFDGDKNDSGLLKLVNDLEAIGL